MGEAAILHELAHSRLLVITTHLGLVVAVDGANVVSAWIVSRHWIVHASFLSLSMSEGARVSQATGLEFLEMTAKGRFVLDIRHLVFVVRTASAGLISIVVVPTTFSIRSITSSSGGI